MIYLGTHDMDIYNFTKCLIKDDLRYMVIGWNERDEIDIPSDTEEKWLDIFNSYCDKTRNNDTDTYYALINEIDYLRKRFFMLEVLVKELNDTNKEQYGAEIILWDFPFDYGKPVKDQKKNFERNFRIASQDIELREDDLKKMLQENGDGEPVSLYKKKIKLERITGLKIDLKTTVLDEWIQILKEAEEINEEHKKAMVKNG